MTDHWKSNLSRLGRLVVGRRKKVEYLHIETSNECNFRCRMCPLIVARASEPASGGLTGRGIMSFDDFKTILDKIPLHEISSASVQGFGEVMLNPDFLRIARYAKGKGLRVGFNSNMSLLTEDMAEALIDCGIDELDFSIDSIDPDLFAALREGTPLPRLLENVACFVRVRQKKGAFKPALGFRVVASRLNLHEVPGIVVLAAEMGACRVVFQDLDGEDGLVDVTANRLDATGHGELTALCRKAQEDHPTVAIQVANFNRLQPRRAGETVCRAPWQELYVRVDGFLTPCCHIQDPSILGYANLLRQGFDEIWNAEAYRRFRRELKGGRPRGCMGCTVY